MLENFEGIVLFKRDYKEQDALVKIFTPAFGTKMFYIKGLNKGSHPLQSMTLPLTRNQYVGTIHDTGLSFIREGESLQTYRQIQTDFINQAYAVYMSQLFDAAIDDNTPAPELYQLFQRILEKLDQGMQAEILTTFVELHLLTYFGVGLNFKHCVKCDNVQGPFDFSVTHGGLLCHHHWSMDPYRLQISPKSVHVAYMLANIHIDQVNQVNLSQETLQGLRLLMDEIYKEFVGIKLRGKSYLDKIQAFEANVKK